jgi:uncharacterized protein (TIGR02996 family)
MARQKSAPSSAASPQEQGLLANIGENPDDDTPRLVYADWVEEHGRPERADFIRLHVAWCRRASDAPPDEVLSQRLVSAWEAAGLHRATLPGKTPHVYDRGFVAGVRFEGHGPITDQVEAVLESVPIRVAFFWPIGEVNAAWLAESPLLDRLTGLCCADSPGVVGQLLGSPHLAGLNLLHVGVEGSEEAVEAARLIAAAQHLDRLTVLDLDGTHIGDEGLEFLAGAGQLHSIRKLTLRSDNRGSHPLGEQGIGALITSRSLTQLTHLGFCDCSLDGDALQWLLDWDGAGQLLELNLSFTGRSGENVIALARCRKLSNLRRLCLSAFELTDDAVRALAAANALPALRELHVEEESEYGMWDDQTSEMLGWLAERLGPQFTLGVSDGHSFELSPVGEADRIWRRLHRLGWSDETGLGVSRIL